MDKTKTKSNSNINGQLSELQNEKVRNIVGEVPSLLIRQGIMIIGFSILFFIGIFAFIPYKKVFQVQITLLGVSHLEQIHSSYHGIFVANKILTDTVQVGQILGNVFHDGMITSIASPAKGRVTFNVTNNDSVKLNDLIGVVVTSACKTYGICEISVADERNIEIGQNVITHYGKDHDISGIISDFKLVESNDLKNMIKLRIDYQEQNSDILDKKCNGEIVLSDMSMLEYFFKSMKL